MRKLIPIIAVLFVFVTMAWGAELKVAWDDGPYNEDKTNLPTYWLIWFGNVDANGDPINGPGTGKDLQGKAISSPYKVTERTATLVLDAGQWSAKVQACNEIGCCEELSNPIYYLAEEETEPEDPPPDVPALSTGFTGTVTYFYENGLLAKIITKEGLQ